MPQISWPKLGVPFAGALTAVAVGLVVCGFLLTQSLDDPQTGGILLFAGVSLGAVVIATAPFGAPALADRGFPLGGCRRGR